MTERAFNLHKMHLKSYLPRTVGTYTHEAIELLILMSLQQHGFTKGIQAEEEVGKLGKQPDLQIPLSAAFLTAIGTLNKLIPQGIRELVVDFTHEAKRRQALSAYWFIDKYYKQYQSEDRFLFVVLTHPSWTQSDINQITKDLNQRRPPFARNIKVILLEDFLNALNVQEKIKSKIEELYNLVGDCLQRYDPDLREESLDKLRDIYEQAKMFLKFPLSQLRLAEFTGSFFNIN